MAKSTNSIIASLGVTMELGGYHEDVCAYGWWKTQTIIKICVWICAVAFISFSAAHPYKRIGKQKRESILHKAGSFLGGVALDVVQLHYYLFTQKTAHIITLFTPFYLTTRLVDEDVQSRFYDAGCRKNKNQFSSTVHQLARFGVGIPMAALASLMFFGPTADMRTTARIFALGWPFVHFTKDLIKKIDTKACLRPWNEHFNTQCRSTGGFPSGHMANMVYTATLWGLRYGWKWGVPLSLSAAFVFANFVNCNRHYMSQLVAGGCLGMVYAFAAHKLIECRISQRLHCSLDCSRYGTPQLSVAYHF